MIILLLTNRFAEPYRFARTNLHAWDPFHGLLKSTDTDMTDLAIPFPEAGNLAILSFEFNDFLALEEKYGDEYVKTIFAGLDRSNAAMIRDVLAIGLKGGDITAALGAVPVDVIGARIADALYLRLKGFKVSEAVPA